jgi:MFS family permease
MKSTPFGPWLIVALGFLALSLAYSARAALGLLMPTWEQELGWSRSFISAGAAGALVVMAALAPLGGRLVDLHGSRNVLIVGLLALALGSLMVSATDSQILYILAFSGVSAIGFGLVATHVVSTAVEQGFEKNQGLAIGIATSGSTAGQFVIVPLIAWLLAITSWRWSFVALAIASVAMILCILWWFPKRGRIPNRSRGAVQPSESLARDIRFILKKPAFQILFWSYFICGYTTSGVIETHLLPYASFCGFAPVPSATAYGLLSAVNLAGMILAGWLTDRMNRPLLLGSIYVIRGLTFIVLANVGADIETLFLFAALFGLVDYSTVPVTASLIASHIGLRVMGLAFGIITAGHQIGAAIGAYLGGYLFDSYASYGWVWWSSVWLAVFAGVLVFLLRERAATPEPA